MEPLCRIRDVYRSINDFETEFFAVHGVKLNEGMLLCSLSKFGQCTSGQVAELLELTNSTASKVIMSTEKKGLVERSMGTGDRRQMIFRLTQKGKERIDRIHCESENMIALINRIREI